MGLPTDENYDGFTEEILRLTIPIAQHNSSNI
jgi:hypothetical protein